MANFYKKSFWLFFFTFLSVFALAQDFGNSWLKNREDLPYFKIQVSREGFYKISYELLSAKNAPANFFSSEKLRLWHRGKQQAISVRATDGILKNGDYLVFYGQKNDGWQDSLLYHPNTELYNKYSSLYTDTTAYFLTVSDEPNYRTDTLKGLVSETSLPNVRTQLVRSFYEDYFQMAYDGEDASQTHAVPGEGWGTYRSDWMDPPYMRTEIISLKDYVPNSTLRVEALVQGRERKQLTTKFYVQGPSDNMRLALGTAIDSTLPYYYGVQKVIFETNADLTPYIEDGNIKIVADYGGGANFSLSYLRVDFTKKADLLEIQKESFTVDNTASQTVLPHVSDNHWLGRITEIGNTQWIKDSLINGNAYLPTLGPNEKIFYSTSLDSISNLESATFREYIPTDSTYLILTHPSLMASSREYGAYRASASGGRYDTLIANVHQVINQFGYGERHPLGIRRFLNHLKNQNIHSPDHFLIIGQGMQLDYQKETRNDPSKTPSDQDMIMTAGVPGGDYIFSVGLDGKESSNGYDVIHNFYSTIPTGRLQVNNNDRVRIYLDKVKEHESPLLNVADWRRNVLHLSGGYQWYQSADYNQRQAQIIRNYMDGLANIARQPFFGANVLTIGRTSTTDSVIDITSQVNKGTSFITFLGHSGRIVSDIWIDLVSTGNLPYNNKGKYPVLFLNGCRMGDVYVNFENKYQEPSVLLDWLLTPNKGAILCIGSSGTTFLTSVSRFMQSHYTSSFMDSSNLAKSMGEQMVLAQQKYLRENTSASNPDMYSSSLIGNYSLQGDPAVHLFPNPKADYSMDCEKLSLRPLNNRKITTLSDSFDIAIPINNHGMFTNQKFEISVKRLYSNNTQNIQYPPQTYFPVRQYDTLYYRVRGALPLATGQNTFEITIDPGNAVPELDKGNNNCSLVAYVPGVTMVCISPTKFGIVNKQPVTFVAQSSTPTAKERDFYMELDTTYLFNSPFKKSFTTKAFDLPTWNSALLADVHQNDSIVYYWRTRYVQPEATEDTAFSYSSFIYIKDSPEGWSQSEYPQFFEDDAQTIKLDSATGKWDFFKIKSSFKALTTGSRTSQYDTVSSLSYRNIPLIYKKNCQSGGIDGLYILTINSLNLNVKRTHLGVNGTYQCDAYSSPLVTRVNQLSEEPSEGNNFRNQRDSLYRILDQNIQKGDYVLIMTIGNAYFSKYNNELKTLLREQFDASRIDSLQDGSPYLLFTRKGYSKVVEKYPVSVEPQMETLELDTTFESLGYAGQISSPLIGPATKWDHFIRAYEKDPLDSIRFDISGVELSGKETIVANDVRENNFDLGGINALQYPYLRLQAYKQTQTANTPQLLKWQVILQKSAEGTLVFDDSSTSKYASFSKQEGDTSKVLGFTFKNISSQAFLPYLLVRYKITNANKSIVFYDTLRTSLPPDSSWKPKIRVPSLGWAGNNTLEVFFNPPPGQTEEHLENNQFKIAYTITSDKTNPILDVAFDGRRIMNGEIIAPNPTISIGVNDENKYLIRQDAAGIVVDLQRPCGQPNCPFERINLNSNEVTIYPAGSSNKFELRYKPTSLPDGTYTLRVQASDLSGNPSGIKPYTIQFEIINETSISNFLPYPNPFSSKMWFIYTLTGEVPDQVRVQVMTITGKIVRQLFLEELGPLYIGTHRTEFVWDGTDDYGDQLANGLYLYSVTARKNGEVLKHRQSSVDGMFKDGYGKLYILR